jgi:hypothetical protein
MLSIIFLGILYVNPGWIWLLILVNASKYYATWKDLFYRKSKPDNTCERSCFADDAESRSRNDIGWVVLLLKKIIKIRFLILINVIISILIMLGFTNEVESHEVYKV